MCCHPPHSTPCEWLLLLEFPVFQSAPFLAFVEEMRAKLEHEAQPENDPNLKAVDRALPGVNKQFTRTRTLVTECHVAAEEAAFYAVEAADGITKLEDRVSRLEETLNEMPAHTKKHGRKTRDLIRNFASCLKRGFNVFEDEGETDDEGGAFPAADASPSSPARGRRFDAVITRTPELRASPTHTPPEPVQEEEGKSS